MIITTKFELGERVCKFSYEDPVIYTVQSIIVDASGVSYICIDAQGIGEVMAEDDLI
jgi:hypothetical protein